MREAMPKSERRNQESRKTGIEFQTQKSRNGMKLTFLFLIHSFFLASWLSNSNRLFRVSDSTIEKL